MQAQRNRNHLRNSYIKNQTTQQMKQIMLFAALVLITSCTMKNADSSEGQWIRLFNGEDLDGWDIKIAGYDLNEKFGNTFRVEDGLLKVRYDAYDTFTNQFG